VIALGPLNGGPSGYGFLEAVIGAGAFVGAFAASELIRLFPAGRLILLGVGGMGLAYAVTGLSHNLLVPLLFLFLGGVANTIYYVPLISLTQREAPNRIRGRVMATRFLLVQAGLLGGMALAGPLTERVGPSLVFLTAGLLSMLAAFLGFLFPNLRNAQLRDPAEIPSLEAASG
jgi:MFS family permease